MAIASNFPSIRPSLLLDFASVGRLDPRVTFTRASSATYYDGVTTAKAEENLFLQSQDFLTTWAPNRAVRTANADTAPDGTVTADSIVQAAGQTTAGTVSQSANAVAADYVISVFAKPNGRNFLIIRESLLDGTSNDTWFDVQNGTIGTTDAGHTATITASTNSYYRCSIKFTANAARSGAVNFYIADTDGSLVVADDGNGLYLWGAQLEQRSAVTAYTPTTTQSITNYIPVLQTAAAGVARFDHDPTTGEALGLLIEEQRTNLVTYSDDFADAAWGKTNSSITSNTIVAPDGTLTGDKLVENTSTSTHGVSQNATVVDATTYTFSCYAKLGERTKFRIRFGTSGGGGSFLGSADFDLSAGTVDSSSITSASITAVGNGWYRCVATDVSSGTTLGCAIFLIETGTTTSYTGDGYSGIYIWGAQLEAGAFATSYIPTTSASATRNADAASMTGTNFSSWYNAAAGSVAWEASTATPTAGSPTIFSFNDGTANNRIQQFFATNLATRLRAGGSTYEPGAVGATVTANVAVKGALAWTTNSAAATLNTATPTTSSTVVVPTVDRFAIGSNESSGLQVNGAIRRISYYPVALTSSQLQALTG